MNDLFCVVSAVGNDYGVFSYRERLEQLKATVASVRQKVPGADVVIYDASEDPLPDADVAELKSLVERFVQIHDDKYVNFLKHRSLDPSPNKFEKKTVGEIQCMTRFLSDLKQSGRAYRRVFKLSGRYRLSEHFDLESHLKAFGKCVFLPKEEWFDAWVFRIRLWSFDYSLLDWVTEVFDSVQKRTYGTVTDTGKLEIVEYAVTLAIEELKVPYETIERIGVTGLMGLHADKIDE